TSGGHVGCADNADVHLPTNGMGRAVRCARHPDRADRNCASDDVHGHDEVAICTAGDGVGQVHAIDGIGGTAHLNTRRGVHAKHRGVDEVRTSTSSIDGDNPGGAFGLEDRICRVDVETVVSG